MTGGHALYWHLAGVTLPAPPRLMIWAWLLRPTCAMLHPGVAFPKERRKTSPKVSSLTLAFASWNRSSCIRQAASELPTTRFFAAPGEARVSSVREQYITSPTSPGSSPLGHSTPSARR